MILAFLIGCLTPETFRSEYGLALCAGIEECDGRSPSAVDCPDPPDLPEMDCETWDAAAASACLDALEHSCGTMPDECKGFEFCG